ncbi:MAG: hypothetical protein BGN86_14255 [Caulobacterales bacterium 68-7]|nr:MAG: hypothetical protein BGN86_14255 [Caulobacterales bacterium 68-7]
MGVRVDSGFVRLEGDCGVEDAEAVVAALMADAAARVDLSQCRQLHTAVVQALLVFRPRIDGTPADHFLATFVAPALQSRPESLHP